MKCPNEAEEFVMRQVSIVEDHTELQKTIICKSIHIEKHRSDRVNPAGIWETYLQYGDYAKGALMGYLIMKKGEPKIPTNYSFISELHIKEDSSTNFSVYQKLLRQQTYTNLLLESAEEIAKKEHESIKIAVDYQPSSSMMFVRMGYEDEGKLMIKELKDIEHVCLINMFACVDLLFNENKNLIQNPVDADVDEREWLKRYDEEYRRHKSCSL